MRSLRRGSLINTTHLFDSMFWDIKLALISAAGTLLWESKKKSTLFRVKEKERLGEIVA